jgi:hypothetical protein
MQLIHTEAGVGVGLPQIRKFENARPMVTFLPGREILRPYMNPKMTMSVNSCTKKNLVPAKTSVIFVQTVN